ncbi:hypothetical protein GGF32_000895 [Allomyces javanicus]|nr:hypothetical protein GGF32_000895 [Allomyces javanicus]
MNRLIGKEIDSSAPYFIALQSETKRLLGANMGLRIRACTEIGHIVYHGGELVQTVLSNDPRVIDQLLSIVRAEKPQPLPLQVAAIRALSVIVRAGPVIQEMLEARGLMDMLLATLKHPDEEMRVYTCHTLLFFLIKSIDKYAPSLCTAEVQGQLRRAALDDWTFFQYNDAEELMKLLEIPYDPYLVSGCIQSAKGKQDRGMSVSSQGSGGFDDD